MKLLNQIRPSDSGAAAVEMAIVLPVLIALAFGIIDFGRIFNAEIQLSQAAREGVRIAYLTDTNGKALYTAGDVVARAQAGAGMFSTDPGLTVTPVAQCGGGAANASVTVNYSIQGIFWSKALSQTAVMKCAS